MYKYFRVVESKKFSYGQKILITPEKPRFHKNWEWKYDFPEIRKKIYQVILYYYKSFVIWLINKLNLTEYPCYYESSMKEIEISDLEEFIYRNVQEACKYLYNQKCMIVFGPDVRSDLIKLTQSFEFSGRFKFEVNTRDERLLFFQDIPMVYIPTISGVHVLPDATGKWTELVQKPEPTAYGKFRRYF